MKNYIPIEYSSGDDYEIFVTVKEDTPYFSFEYPSNYGLSDQTGGTVNPSLYVVLSCETFDEFMGGIHKSIVIGITNYTPRYMGLPDAETSMEHRISMYKWSLERNYRLREKHKAVVGGVEGWEIIISYRQRPEKPSGHGTPPDPAFIVARELFFDYQGITWHIYLYTDADSYEKETKEVFEHILQTFKFHE